MSTTLARAEASRCPRFSRLPAKAKPASPRRKRLMTQLLPLQDMKARGTFASRSLASSDAARARCEKRAGAQRNVGLPERATSAPSETPTAIGGTTDEASLAHNRGSGVVGALLCSLGP